MSFVRGLELQARELSSSLADDCLEGEPEFVARIERECCRSSATRSPQFSRAHEDQAAVRRRKSREQRSVGPATPDPSPSGGRRRSEARSRESPPRPSRAHARPWSPTRRHGLLAAKILAQDEVGTERERRLVPVATRSRVTPYVHAIDGKSYADDQERRELYRRRDARATKERRERAAPRSGEARAARAAAGGSEHHDRGQRR